MRSKEFNREGMQRKEKEKKKEKGLKKRKNNIEKKDKAIYHLMQH